MTSVRIRVRVGFGLGLGLGLGLTSSKCVGDLAIYLVNRGLDTSDVIDEKKVLRL